MQTTSEGRSRSTTSQKLIAVGALVALAILSLQAYALVANGAISTTGLHKVSGSVDPPATGNSTISVSGSGQVEITPNLAILTIGVNTQDQSAQGAAQQNAATMTKIITALGALGINASSIQTVSYNIYQQNSYPVAYGGQTNAPSGASTFEVDNEIQVTISSSSGQGVSQLGTQVGAAIDAAVAQGANEVYGVQFTASQSAIQQANQQALQLAVQDASGQAKSIAGALGVTITGVISVNTNPVFVPTPVVSDLTQGAVSSQTPIISPESLTISATVQAVYAIS